MTTFTDAVAALHVPEPRHDERRLSFRAVAVAFIVAGVFFFGQGIWIFMKAQLAQVLLHHAWRQTLGGREQVRPWPWADTWPVARLRVAGDDYIVLAGASGRTLAFGPGHVDGSALPGTSGNCVISGHRDTHFSSIRRLATGDRIEVTGRDGGVHVYDVRESRIVNKFDTTVLETGPTGRLTLITCYPFDAAVPGGPLRYVVIADLINEETLP